MFNGDVQRPQVYQCQYEDEFEIRSSDVHHRQGDQIMDTSFEHFPEIKPPNLRFALATLLVVAISAGIGLFVYLEMTKPEVVAYLQVCRSANIGWSKNFFEEESEQEFDRYRRTQIEMLRSKSLLVRAVRSPSISGLSFLRYKSDPVAWLKENLKIDYPNDAELLRVRLSANDPIQAAQAVDAVIHAYFKEFIEKQTTDRARFEIKLREQLQEKTDSLLRDMHNADHLAQNLGDGAPRRIRNCKLKSAASRSGKRPWKN